MLEILCFCNQTLIYDIIKNVQYANTMKSMYLYKIDFVRSVLSVASGIEIWPIFGGKES